MRPMFCIAITSMPNEAVVAKSTVAFAVTLLSARVKAELALIANLHSIMCHLYVSVGNNRNSPYWNDSVAASALAC